ncbi:hypothetical protein NDU88_003412 [Pleurodeles waltl]|uniref:Uncharacterized protein n=1 Tax=Pleurodeles waltl TaxID=8319 RepID=A0AAV7VD94_PLEWA|nr:hypothetical protein NDU88_003412 [Pleurodeles waltl]
MGWIASGRVRRIEAHPQPTTIHRYNLNTPRAPGEHEGAEECRREATCSLPSRAGVGPVLRKEGDGFSSTTRGHIHQQTTWGSRLARGDALQLPATRDVRNS